MTPVPTQPVKVKICGVTRAEDAAGIAAAGIEFIGLNFWPSSKRYLPAERAPEVAAAARAAGAVRLVGVFVNARVDEVVAIARDSALDAIQLHGDESPAELAAVHRLTGCSMWKAIPVGRPGDLSQLDVWPADAILLDTPTAGRGGSGRVFDWTLARDARRTYPRRQFVLAGGLGPDNVRAAIDAVSPWAVDVASGVESAPGIKDPAKLAAFLAAVRV
ncbi:MAG TPA: phosphoribosylanthranilate isomerase [Kofleriaceae bacterium]|nr:phosphoribosylanthranilate isomerase [Kofleriaceae bacterium]